MGLKQTLKAQIRDICTSTLSVAGLTQFSRYSNNTLTVITFHRVLPTKLRNEYPLPNLAVTPEELEWVLNCVKPHFEIKTLSDAYDTVIKGSQQKPLLAVTFDDGQVDNLEYGLPVLSALDVPATFYIPTAFIESEQLLWHDEAGFAWLQLGSDRRSILNQLSPVAMPERAFVEAKYFFQFMKSLQPEQRSSMIAEMLVQLAVKGGQLPSWSRLMNWSELRHLHDAGHEIGSHARTHNLLGQLSATEQGDELHQSFDEIEKALGIEAISLCYPDGNYNQDTLAILANSRYKTAVTTQWGINRVNSDNDKQVDPFQLLRCDIDADQLRNRKGELSAARFQFRLSKFQPGL